MHIDVIPKKITAPKFPNTIFTGTKYCLCYSNEIPKNWDGTGDTFNWKNSMSVLWSKTELNKFRPNDTVHNFIQSCMEGMKEEIAQLKNKVKTAETHWVHSSNSKLTCNHKKNLQDRISFLKNNTIVFVEINFI